MMRTLRLARLLRFLREFRKMAYALTASAQTLFWSWVLLLAVVYVFAIFICQGVSNARLDLIVVPDAELEHVLVEAVPHFGSLLRTIYTLYSSITQGISWGAAADSLHRISSLYSAGFIAFISISFLGA